MGPDSALQEKKSGDGGLDGNIVLACDITALNCTLFF